MMTEVIMLSKWQSFSSSHFREKKSCWCVLIYSFVLIPLLHWHSQGQSKASLRSGKSSGAEPRMGVWGSSGARFSLPWCFFADQRRKKQIRINRYANSCSNKMEGAQEFSFGLDPDFLYWTCAIFINLILTLSNPENKTTQIISAQDLRQILMAGPFWVKQWDWGGGWGVWTKEDTEGREIRWHKQNHKKKGHK